MRETRNAQASIFEHYSNHEYGVRLRKLSEVLDSQPEILELVAADLIDTSVSAVGRQRRECVALPGIKAATGVQL